MRLKLFLCAVLFCAITKAQTNTELKDFINKNTGAIRTIQKNMLRENNSTYTSSFKEIIKNQVAAIKLYNSDNKASTYFAFLVRTESINFFKSHSQTNVADHFEFTETEKTFSKSAGENTKTLSSSEIKTINEMDAMKPQELNNLTLTIQ